MKNRLEVLRAKVDDLILESGVYAGEFYSHLYSVSKFGALLALKRGLDPEIAQASGMLHDIYQVTNGTTEQHGARGAVVAEKILRETGLYSEEEIKTITTAIHWHSKKRKFHGPYDELLKDADVMNHFLYNTDISDRYYSMYRHLDKGKARYESILAELGINGTSGLSA